MPTPPHPLEPDVPIPADLLAHAGALRRLARGVVGDADAAEDVVQETWIVALERPPAGPRSLGAWLAAVARRLAFRRARGERRRHAREARAATPESAPAALAQRAALAALTHAVLALEEPYQTAILLRFYEDLPPRVVAERTGVPLATAKSRIARGLARLRERLEGEFEGPDGLRGALGFLVGPALPAGPLPRAAPAGGGTSAAGAIAMGAQAKVAAGLAAAICGLWAWQGAGREAQGPAAPTVDGAQQAARPWAQARSAGGGDGGLALPSGPQKRAPLAPEDQEPAFEDATIALLPEPFDYLLEGRAVGEDDLSVPGAVVLVAPLGAPLNRTVETDADGRFTVRFTARTPTLEATLEVKRGGTSSGLRRLRLGAGRTELALRLEDSGAAWIPVALRGAADGEAGEAVLESATASDDWTPDFAADADGRGRFSLHVDQCPALSLHFSSELFPMIDELVHGLRGRLMIADGTLTFADEAEGVQSPPMGLAGVARGADGESLPGVPIVLGTAPGRGDGPRTQSGADGAFALLDVEPGVWHARAGGGDLGLAERTVTIAAHGTTVWDPWLDRELEIAGRLIDASGAPLPGYAVGVRGFGREDGAVTGEGGAFAIPNLPRTAFDVLVRSPGAPRGAERACARGVVPGGAPLEIALSPDVAPGVLLRVEHQDGKPASGASARLFSLATGNGVELARVDGGYGTGAHLPAGAYEAEVLVADRAPVEVGPLWLGGPPLADLPSATDLDAGVVARLAPRGKLLFCESPGGRAERWVARLWRLEGGARLLALEEEGPLPERLSLAPGSYELDLEPNPEHAGVAALLERGAAPEGRRLAFDVVAGETLRFGVRRGSASAAAGPLAPEAEPPAAAGDPGTQVTLRVDVADLRMKRVLPAGIDEILSRRRCAACH